MKKKQKSGISLIVLVITIIVIIILAVAVILSIANNNPIENANKAKFQSDLKTMQEELELIKQKNYIENQGKSYQNSDETDISIDQLSISAKYEDKFAVKNGILVCTNLISDEEKKWAAEKGIEQRIYVLKNGIDGVTIVDGLLSGHYEGTETDITIPNTVRSIESKSFSGCTSLTSVTIPSSVKNIGLLAFYSCPNLKSIVIEGEPRFKRSAIDGPGWGVKVSQVSISGSGYIAGE